MSWMIFCCLLWSAINWISKSVHDYTTAMTARCRRAVESVRANDWVANVIRWSQRTHAIITAIGPDNERPPRQASAPSFRDKLRLRNVTGGAFKNSTKHDAQHGSPGRTLTVALRALMSSPVRKSFRQMTWWRRTSYTTERHQASTLTLICSRRSCSFIPRDPPCHRISFQVASLHHVRAT